MSKVAILIISCSCDEQKLKKLFHLEHSHIRNDDDFDDDDDAMGHGVCQIMTFVDGGGWGSGKTQNKMTSFMNSAIVAVRGVVQLFFQFHHIVQLFVNFTMLCN